jgi:hypothetical protein
MTAMRASRSPDALEHRAGERVAVAGGGEDVLRAQLVDGEG